MVAPNAVFRYKTIKGPLHKLPAMLKLFLLLPLSVLCMSLSANWLTVGIITAALTAFLCRFTLREQLTDLKPAFIYAALMYALSVFSNLFENLDFFLNLRAFAPLREISSRFFLSILLPRPEFLRIALRLVLIIQLSALLFRTTSSIETREGLRSIFFKSSIAENISLFLGFIPEIFKNWTSINLAWKARGGKQGIRKIKTVVFVLISLSMEKAAVKAKAINARSCD